VTTLDAMLRADRAPMAFAMTLIAIAGAVALLLGLIGIYGVISYLVAQRSAEIGVRMALGARPGDVAGMILRQGASVAVAGLVVGFVVAVAGSRLLTALLFEVSATDPATYSIVAALLLSVALLACWLPARRAARLDPVDALRNG
jgi:ABC-type antimicrobial peptide transport system permease subunit